MYDDPISAFRSEIEAYLSKTGMSPTAFGRTAAGDPGLVFQLREGREPRFSTISRVRAWMAANAEAAA